MFFQLNKITKKQISLFIILVIFLSCITVAEHDFNKGIKSFDINENLLDKNLDVFYEMLIIRYNTVENKYRDKSLKINYNDKLAILFEFITTNIVDKYINIANFKSLSEFYLIQDAILLFIHDKDGKKQII